MTEFLAALEVIATFVGAVVLLAICGGIFALWYALIVSVFSHWAEP